MYSQYLALLLAVGTVSAVPCKGSHGHSQSSGLTLPSSFPSSSSSSSVAAVAPTSVYAPSSIETTPSSSSSSAASVEEVTSSSLAVAAVTPSSIATTSSAAAATTTSLSLASTVTAAPTSSSAVSSAAAVAATTTSAAAVSSNENTGSSSSTTAADSAAATQYCGAPNDYEIISDTPWIVYSMNYNYEDISGSCCTGYYDVTGADENQTIHWNSIWDISESVSTDVVKGYSFIGLTQNLETTLADISSIPSTYQWSVSNTTAYKGNVVYDFMTSDTKGDSTSSAAQELMLWLHYEGGQVPIGWADGAVATIDGLYGKDGWQLYQGQNTDTGITVSSLLVAADDMFAGDFSGDIKDWLSAMADQGIFSTSTYVNVGNAGMEPYWGTVTFDNYLSLRIEL